jgi:hypothetical protein
VEVHSEALGKPEGRGEVIGLLEDLEGGPKAIDILGAGSGREWGLSSYDDTR